MERGTAVDFFLRSGWITSLFQVFTHWFLLRFPIWLYSLPLCAGMALKCVIIKWFVPRRGILYHWLNGCCLHYEWRHLVSVWPVHSRRSRAHGLVLPPSWWYWGPSVVWRPPLSGWSFSEPRTPPCTVHSALAAGSASLSEKKNGHTVYSHSKWLKSRQLVKAKAWFLDVLFPEMLSHCPDSKWTWQRWGSDWVMRVSAKAVAALCFNPPCQVRWTSQSMFIIVMRSGSGDRPSLSSSACSHVFPSSRLTIKYHLHFRLIKFWDLLGTQNFYILSLHWIYALQITLCC